MKASASVSGSKISVQFDLEDIIECSSDEEVADLAQSLSCRDVIVAAVCDQLCEGWTENISSAGDLTLARARRSIMDRVEQFQTQASKDRKSEAASIAHRAYLDGVHTALEALCGPCSGWSQQVDTARKVAFDEFKAKHYAVW